MRVSSPSAQFGTLNIVLIVVQDGPRSDAEGEEPGAMEVEPAQGGGVCLTFLSAQHLDYHCTPSDCTICLHQQVNLDDMDEAEMEEDHPHPRNVIEVCLAAI